MKVLSLGWLGIRTKDAVALSAFFRDVLKLELLQDQSTGTRFHLSDGTEVHVYGSDDSDHEFFGSGPVVGFAVESFASARAYMAERGVEFVYPEPQRGGGRAWQHFRGVDGNVYELIGPDDLDPIDRPHQKIAGAGTVHHEPEVIRVRDAVPRGRSGFMAG